LRFLADKHFVVDTADGELVLRENEQQFRSAFAHAAIGMAITDATGKFIDVNPAFCRITGYQPGELSSIDFPSIIHPDDRERREALLEQLLRGEIPSFVIEKRLRRRGEGWVWVRDSVSIANDLGDTPRVIVLMEDITARKQAEEDLRASEERFRVAAENASDMVYEWDLCTGQVTTYGMNPDRFGGRMVPEDFEAFKRMVHPDDLNRVEAALRRQIEHGERYECEYRLLGEAEEVYFCSDRGVALRDRAGQPYKWVGLVTDITRRIEAQEAISQLAAIVEWSEDAIVGISLSGSITSWNQGAEKLLGHARSQAVGRQVANLLPTSDVLSIIERALRGEVHWVTEAGLLRSDGNVMCVSLTISPIRKPSGEITGVAMIARDIRERKRAEQQLEHQTWHDSLTGLPNRMFLAERLEGDIVRAQHGAHMTGVIYIDLDGFKFVNETLGHEAGDILLQQVTERLNTRVRLADTLARMGGDEFMLVIPEMSAPNVAMSVAERLADVLKEPFQIAGHKLYITASVGISVYPQDGSDVSALRRAADSAMYEAKRGGKNCIRFYRPEMNNSYVERLELEPHLRGALDLGELSLEFQPILRLSDERPVTYEALLRWFHPSWGSVPPSRIIPVAEETGLIIRLGEWVMAAACRECQAWQKRGLELVRVAVNASALEFAQPKFVENVLAILDRTGMPSDLLDLELTETMLMRDIEGAIQKMSQLRARGIRISVDDFGTGYSSLGYLHRLPIDTLKIDRCFVSDIGVNSSAVPLISGMISLAHSIGKRVVAEGVETRVQLDMLRKMGCDEVQGLLLGRPEPLPCGWEGQLAALSQGVAGTESTDSVTVAALID
jgi:diguanylate cyclase (GGDEF)-like protein/PAS domain S-box-containing protein